MPIILLFHREIHENLADRQRPVLFQRDKIAALLHLLSVGIAFADAALHSIGQQYALIRNGRVVGVVMAAEYAFGAACGDYFIK